MANEIDSLSLSGRITLLGMAHLSKHDDTPAHTGEVIRTCTEYLETGEVETLGKLSEAEANRALNRLEDGGFVETADVGDASPVGKGRPSYTLALDTDRVLSTLGDDDEVAPLVEQVEAEA